MEAGKSRREKILEGINNYPEEIFINLEETEKVSFAR